jgi:tRNA (guanine37-N1)-methyltransferase
MTEPSVSASVDKKDGERALNLLSIMGILDKRLQIQKDAEFISLPLTRRPNADELQAVRLVIPSFQVKNDFFHKKPDTQKTFEEILTGQISADLIKKLPRALDVIGEIAVVEIPSELEAFEKLIGEAILRTHKNVRTVLAKAGSIAGEYRVREYRVIAGEDRTTTVHKEYGCRFMVDIAKAYFSPRLSREHKRVAALVQKNETVIDLFTGVGPFSILIAKNRPDVKVFAIDINPVAINLAEKNIRLNRVEDRVAPILGDARRLVEERFSGVADRVIMNLPEKSNEFVDVACKALKPSGGTIHYYGFVRLPETIHDKESFLIEEVKKNKRKLDSLLFVKAVRETAPYEMQFVIDAKIL